MHYLGLIQDDNCSEVSYGNPFSKEYQVNTVLLLIDYILPLH